MKGCRCFKCISADEARKRSCDNSRKRAKRELRVVNKSINEAIKSGEDCTCIDINLCEKTCEILRNNGYSVRKVGFRGYYVDFGKDYSGIDKEMMETKLLLRIKSGESTAEVFQNTEIMNLDIYTVLEILSNVRDDLKLDING